MQAADAALRRKSRTALVTPACAPAGEASCAEAVVDGAAVARADALCETGGMRTPLAAALGLLAASTLASCAKPAPKAVPEAFDLSLDMKEMMGHVVDPAAWAFWRASGETITKAGVESLTPKTEEGWEAAESGAAQVAAAGNLMLIPGYMRDTTDWPRFSRQLIKAGLDGKAAAEAHDPQRMFTTGAAIYQVCTGCHAKYVIPAAAQEEAESEKTRPARLADWPDDVKAMQEAYARRARAATAAPDAASPAPAR